MRLLILALALCSPAVAQTRVDAQVTAARQRAAKLAAAGRLDAAIMVVQDTRGVVRTARRKDATGVPSPKPPEAYRRALADLERRMRAKAAQNPRDLKSFEALKREYGAEKQALDRRYGVGRAAATANWQAAEAKVMARYDLVDADLASLEGTYQKARGRAERAHQLREEAAVRRLGAYRVLARRAEAEKTARSLLALPPREVATAAAIGDFFQQAGQYGSAEAAWRRGIALLEAPANAKQRRVQLPLFYRQLAFCCSRTGKAEEARRALDRARQAERG